MASSCQLSTINKELIERRGRKQSLSLVSNVEGDQNEPGTRYYTIPPKKDIAGDKQLKRIMANRHSAKESRERRKKLLCDLERSIERLMKENSSLEAENCELRQQLVMLLPQARVKMSFMHQTRQIQSVRQLLSADLFRARSSFRPNPLECLSKQQYFIDPCLLLRHNLRF